VSDIDLFEINEAFAVQVRGSARQIGEDRLNVSGGGIAAGHPFGMTGAGITATLRNNLATYGKQLGVETMCVGGGQGWSWCWNASIDRSDLADQPCT
jgi:acetyl-CoA C-acetyltransferase